MVVLMVIGISGLCSLFEAILYAVPMSHIEGLVQENKVSGKTLRELRRKVDAPITAILSLNTIANTAGAAMAGALAAKVLGAGWIVSFSAVFTLCILLFSEVLPKTVGVVYCRPLSTRIARPLTALIWLFRPMIWLCSLATRLITVPCHREEVSGEEILIMARMGTRSGAIDQDHAAVIENILSMQTRTIREIMTPRTVVFALDGELTVSEARTHDGLSTHSRIPVFFNELEEITGVVYRRDILAAVADAKPDIQLKELMTPAHFIVDSTSVDKALKSFLKREVHMFIVIGERGELSGIVTLEDVLEEVLGQEIVDEFDQVEDMQKLAKARREKVLQEINDSVRS